MKSAIAVVGFLLLLGCSEVDSSSGNRSMKLDIGSANYVELVDFLYEFGGSHRLNILWFGWYQVDSARTWYERSDEKSNFKLKLELLTEKNGYIFVGNSFDEKIASVVIENGDGKHVWLDIVEGFKKALSSKDWQLVDR